MEVSSCICCFTAGERIVVTHRTDSGLGGAQIWPRCFREGKYPWRFRSSLSFGEWLPTSGSSRRIVGCFTLKMKASQSFEILGTACTVTEDLIGSSTAHNLKYCRKISAYAEITAWADPVLNGGTGENHKTSVQIGGVPGISQMSVQRFDATLSYSVSGLKLKNNSENFIRRLRYKPEGHGFDSWWGHLIFHWLQPSGHTMALEYTPAMTDMSTRNNSWE